MNALKMIKKVETDKIIIDNLGEMKGKIAEIIVLFNDDEKLSENSTFQSIELIKIDTKNYNFDRESANER